VTRYAIDGTAAFAIDFETGERRYGTRRDSELALRVFQQADMGVMAWAPVTASDAPAGTPSNWVLMSSSAHNVAGSVECTTVPLLITCA